MRHGRGKEKPNAKAKQLAANKSVAKEQVLKKPAVRKEKRPNKVGTVSKLYAQNAEGNRVVIGRKRDRVPTVESSAQRGRPRVAQNAPRGRQPPARLSSPVPSAVSSESEAEEQPEEHLEEEDAASMPSDDDYQGRLSEGSDEEDQQGREGREEDQQGHEESEEDEDVVADEDLLTDHPLPLIGLVREGKVYLRGPSSFPDRVSHGLLDVTADA